MLGSLGFMLPLLLDLEGLEPAGKISLGIFMMAAIFWIFEPIPIYATSVLIILCQVFLLSDKGVLVSYISVNGYQPQSYQSFYATMSSPIIILFLGGFSLATAAVKFGIDRNLAQIVLKPFGEKPAYVCLGLMVSTAMLSAFMSNTATTAMMITVVIPIIAQLEKSDPFRKVVALAIPIGANIGGIATPIGTPPNAIAIAALRKQGIDIAFSTWMTMAVPLVILMLLVAWRLLLVFFPPATQRFKVELGGKFQKSKPALCAYLIFGLTVLLWVSEKVHGISSSIIAFIPIAVLPCLGVIDKKDIRGFSWEVLWLVAGGISLGLSLQQTGLANWMIGLIQWQHLGGFGLLLAFALVSLFIANLISNTVSATILIPLAVGLGAAGVAGEGFNVAMTIMVIAIIVSFSMALPISTPPNAIAMSTGMIESKDMVKVGLLIGILGLVATLLCSLMFWPMILKL